MYLYIVYPKSSHICKYLFRLPLPFFPFKIMLKLRQNRFPMPKKKSIVWLFDFSFFLNLYGVECSLNLVFMNLRVCPIYFVSQPLHLFNVIIRGPNNVSVVVYTTNHIMLSEYSL